MCLQIGSQNKTLFLPSQLSGYSHNLKLWVSLKILLINKTIELGTTTTERIQEISFLLHSRMPKQAYFALTVLEDTVLKS